MLHQYFQQKNVNPFTDSLERPMKELIDLNIRTLQSFSYFTPVEMLKIRKPEEAMEKNLEIMIENSHAAMSYLQNMFGFMEKHLLRNIDNMRKGTKDISHSLKSTSSASNFHSKATPKKTANSVKSVASKVATRKKGTTPLASASTKTTGIKKQPAKHTGAATNHSDIKKRSATPANSSNLTAGTKPSNTTIPQRFSSSASSSPVNPVLKEIDNHISKSKG